MDKKHGFGIYTWANGQKYEGKWENGKQHGEGKIIMATGEIRGCIYSEGKRIKWLDGEPNEEKQLNIEVQNVTPALS
jgi:hypothetical protein